MSFKKEFYIYIKDCMGVVHNRGSQAVPYSPIT